MYYNRLMVMVCAVTIALGFAGGSPCAWAQSPPMASDAPEKEAPGKDVTVNGDVVSGQPGEKFPDMGKLVFNFDNAELVEVIRTLADLLHINYMLDPGVGGKVTIHTAGELDQKDLFPIFYQILEVNGVTAVKRDNIYKIVPLKDVSRLPIASRMNRTDSIPAGDRVIIQVIRLRSVAAQEIVKVLTPFVSAEGSIVTQENTNILVAVDKADNIAKILRLVDVFDSDIFDRVNYRFYPLQYGDVASMVEIMDKVFTAYGPSVKAGITFIPIDRLNTLLVVGAHPRAFDEIETFVKKYDVPSQSTEPGIYFYPVKNGRASDIAGILNQVFTGKKDAAADKKKTSGDSTFRNPLASDAKYKKKEAAQSPKPAAAASPVQDAGVAVGSGTLNGEARITEDESRNSLIIEASPADYQIIKKLLTQLDILPRQVLIEVMIAEVNLDESSKMGVEWTYLKSDANMSTSLINANMGNSGLQFLVGNPDRWSATLNALASDNKVNILSSPTILASNSIPATIDISQEIPITTSQYQYTSDLNVSGSGLLETSIEYRDTGVMLSVTPNINELGLVTMEINQEVSEQAPSVSVGNTEYPSFYKRSTETTLTVQSGQTIVIGGLIRESKSDGAAGVPWLVTVPGLRWLFGKQSDSYSKTELIIMISPYVLDDFDDVDAVTREFKKKVVNLFPESK
ncbi:MAG: type II secretion system secretin GspD [Desulfosalsimonadaceae bacterium]